MFFRKPSYLTLPLSWRSLWHWLHLLCKTWMQYCITWWSSSLQGLLGKERGVSPALSDFERCVVLNGSCHCGGQTWALMSWFLCSAVHSAAVKVFSTDLTNIHPYSVETRECSRNTFLSLFTHTHTHPSSSLQMNITHETLIWITKRWNGFFNALLKHFTLTFSWKIFHNSSKDFI